MESDGPLFWALFIIGLAINGLLIAFLVTVYLAAREALTFFRRANEEAKGGSAAPLIGPADTRWDDIR